MKYTSKMVNDSASRCGEIVEDNVDAIKEISKLLDFGSMRPTEVERTYQAVLVFVELKNHELERKADGEG